MIVIGELPLFFVFVIGVVAIVIVMSVGVLIKSLDVVLIAVWV